MLRRGTARYPEPCLELLAAKCTRGGRGRRRAKFAAIVWTRFFFWEVALVMTSVICLTKRKHLIWNFASGKFPGLGPVLAK